MFHWDGKARKVANVGESRIGPVGADQSFTEVPSTVLEQLVREGRVVLPNTDTSQMLKETARRVPSPDHAGLQRSCDCSRRAEVKPHEMATLCNRGQHTSISNSAKLDGLIVSPQSRWKSRAHSSSRKVEQEGRLD